MLYFASGFVSSSHLSGWVYSHGSQWHRPLSEHQSVRALPGVHPNSRTQFEAHCQLPGSEEEKKGRPHQGGKFSNTKNGSHWWLSKPAACLEAAGIPPILVVLLTSSDLTKAWAQPLTSSEVRGYTLNGGVCAVNYRVGQRRVCRGECAKHKVYSRIIMY